MNNKAKYIELKGEQKARMDEVREQFSIMYDLIEHWCKPSRETSLAMTKLEEAQYWAIKGITRE